MHIYLKIESHKMPNVVPVGQKLRPEVLLILRANTYIEMVTMHESFLHEKFVFTNRSMKNLTILVGKT